MTKQRELGQYMTPYKIALEMAQTFKKPLNEAVIIDPACGDGNLLLAMAEIMDKAGVKDIPDRLIGIDIDPLMIEKARNKLIERFGEDAQKVKLIEGDFLKFKDDLFNPLLNFGITAVISNPPYGSLREYKFFEACEQILGSDLEKVFLMPLAFIDRVKGLETKIIQGKPFGVTTGHAIIHHTSGQEYVFSSVRGLQTNSSDFEVLSGIKLYEVGVGVPPQTKEIVNNKPYSSSEPKENWLPCLRTGDIRPFSLGSFRLFVDYGPHLAHPKTIERFSGPKIFVRRMPVGKERTLGAVYTDETILCAGDVLVIKHKNDDIELLQGLEVILNSKEAAELITQSRPTVLHRDSYPKISAKDLNYLLNNLNFTEEELRTKARTRIYSNFSSIQNNSSTENKVKSDTYQSLLVNHFPIKEISEASSREKSIHMGHLSTLQMWWARRPLAVSRTTIFAALCPPIEQIISSEKLTSLLNEIVPGTDTLQEKLNKLLIRLAQWETIKDEEFLNQIRNFLHVTHKHKPLVIDSFAGGGSIPVEALRLNLDTYAGELNPVAATALKVAIELLPETNDNWIQEFENTLSSLGEKVKDATKHFYETSSGETVIAYHWCKTYVCENCGIKVPLLKNKWLAKNNKRVSVEFLISDNNQDVEFKVITPVTEKEISDASQGTILSTKAHCPNCNVEVSTKWLRAEGEKNNLSDQMYALTVIDENGNKKYIPADKSDVKIANACELRNLDRRHKHVPSEEFDINGVRHTWAYQYGIKRTSDLYNHRQGTALLEVLHELEEEKERILGSDMPEKIKELYIALLSLVLNRLVLYRTRHTWWQSNGEFPANMFGKQAIAMVWSYVEIPVNSPMTSGWDSTCSWLIKVIKQLSKIPNKGSVKVSDASYVSLDNETVDIAMIDPPYYDSIAYSYLSDVFYVWMKSFLGDVYPDWFNSPLTLKNQEAIVDRPHKLATEAKDDEHFKRKMKESFVEIKRVLKTDGALILMYGHKKIEAWSALIESLLDSGFSFVSSWPVHMERKVKFQHGKVAALSSSLIIVCVPHTNNNKKSISKEEFDNVLVSYLRNHIGKYTSNDLFGSDLATSLIVPACSLLGNYNVELNDSTRLDVKTFLEEIPEKIAQVEMEVLVKEIENNSFSDELKSLARKINNDFPNNSIKKTLNQTWTEVELNDSTYKLAKKFISEVSKEKSFEGQDFYQDYSLQSLKQLLLLFRFLSLGSLDHLESRKIAEASLSRLSLFIRSKF